MCDGVVYFDEVAWPAGELGIVDWGRQGKVTVRIRGTYLKTGAHLVERVSKPTTETYTIMRSARPEEIEIITGVQSDLFAGGGE